MRTAWPILMGLAACATASTVPPVDQTSSPAVGGRAAAAPGTPFIELERGACYGTCPVYTLEISSSGLVSFEGESNVARMGNHSRQLTLEQMKELRTAIASAQFFELKPEKSLLFTTDMATVDLIITDAGMSRHVRLDEMSGVCWSRAISDLAEEIDRIADSAEWVDARPHFDQR